jgi:chloramphenicol phosphotransferase-like protein
VVHAHGDYDIEVDASTHTADECARQIAEEIERLPSENTAFARLRHQQPRTAEDY